MRLSRLFSRGGGRLARPASVITVAAAIMLMTLGLPARAAAYDWTGGSDVDGMSGPSGSVYFAEGTTRNGFEEYLVIRNTGEVVSSVSVTFMFSDRTCSSRVDLEAAPGSGTVLSVNDAVGPGRDVSISVESDNGVVAERRMFFNYKGVWTGGHATGGVERPSDRWYFAEGTTREGFFEWLCLQNQNPDPVRASLSFMLEDGSIVEKVLELDPLSRRTIDVREVVGPGRDVSVSVAASAPVIAERPMYFDYKNTWRGGHTVAGSEVLSEYWYFAEGYTGPGFEEWLCILNPGGESTARVEYVFPEGSPQVEYYQLGAHSRTTVPVNAEVGPCRDVSMKVKAASPVLCERPVYFYYHDWCEGGHVVVGSTGADRVREFPTCSVGPGFESWLCVMNPNDEDNAVRLEISGDGGEYVEEFVMGPNSRATRDLNAKSEGLADPWVRVSGSRGLVAERPSYFTYGPAVESEPFTFATFGGMELLSPVSYRDLLGCVFHEAGVSGSDGLPANAQAMQPIGIMYKDDNPTMRHPGVTYDRGNDPAYFIEDSRGRGTYATTACDVMAKTGSTVYSPVSGTVIEAGSYLLYGKYPDLRVRVSIDGLPGYHMALLHMSELMVSPGQRVTAGETPVGLIRDLVPYFHSGPNPYTREDGNHVHLQINYRPDMGAVELPPGF